MALRQHESVIRQVGPNSYRVVQVWRCATSEAAAAQATLWAATVAGLPGGRYSPLPVDVRRIDCKPCSGRTRFDVFFETLDWVRWLERNPGNGIRIVRASLGSQLPNTDLDDNVISGIDHTDLTGRTRWDIDKGKLTIPYPNAMIRVYAMTRSVATFEQYLDDIGKVSSSGMTHFGPFSSAGEAMLVGIRSTPRLVDADIEAVTHDFLCREGGWAAGRRSRKYELRVGLEDVYDNEGEKIAGVTAKVARMVPTTQWRTPNIYAESNFGQIDQLLSWYM